MEIYDGNVEGGLSPERQNTDLIMMSFHGVFNRHLSQLLDVM